MAEIEFNVSFGILHTCFPPVGLGEEQLRDGAECGVEGDARSFGACHMLEIVMMTALSSASYGGECDDDCLTERIICWRM